MWSLTGQAPVSYLNIVKFSSSVSPEQTWASAKVCCLPSHRGSEKEIPGFHLGSSFHKTLSQSSVPSFNFLVPAKNPKLTGPLTSVWHCSCYFSKNGRCKLKFTLSFDTAHPLVFIFAEHTYLCSVYTCIGTVSLKSQINSQRKAKRKLISLAVL